MAMYLKGICFREKFIFFNYTRFEEYVKGITNINELNHLIASFKSLSNPRAPQLNNKHLISITNKYNKLCIAHFKQQRQQMKNNLPKPKKILFFNIRPKKTARPIEISPLLIDFSGLVLKRVIFPKDLDLRNSCFDNSDLNNAFFRTTNINLTKTTQAARFHKITFYDDIGSVIITSND